MISSAEKGRMVRLTTHTDRGRTLLDAL